MFKFNVRLNGKTIDAVFYNKLPQKTIGESCEDVRRSLINHDGYGSGITVTWPKGQRVTETSYDLEANYGCGFEVIASGLTYREVNQNRKEYRENGDFSAMRIVKRMGRKADQ